MSLGLRSGKLAQLFAFAERHREEQSQRLGRNHGLPKVKIQLRGSVTKQDATHFTGDQTQTSE